MAAGYTAAADCTVEADCIEAADYTVAPVRELAAVVADSAVVAESSGPDLNCFSAEAYNSERAASRGVAGLAVAAAHSEQNSDSAEMPAHSWPCHAAPVMERNSDFPVKPGRIAGRARVLSDGYLCYRRYHIRPPGFLTLRFSFWLLRNR